MKAHPTNFNRLVIAAYRLPFKFIKTKSGYKAHQNSGGLVSAILALSQKLTSNKTQQQKIAWIGMGEKLPEKIKLDSLNNAFDLHPVEIPELIHNKYYGGFCNNMIWPLFHYFPYLTVFDNSYFEAYRKANEAYCNELLKVIKPGDFIWIHDYQLFLLPEMIRKHFPDAVIGFFLHIPFPSFEIIRLMPRKWRSSIIKGMLGADMIGFHTNDYVQHFMKSVKRSVEFECKNNTIFNGDRIVHADAFPIGIDYDKFHDACLSIPVEKEKVKLRKHLEEKKLIFSVDRLDYTKGLLNRLRGFELFLEKHSEWHERVIFNMVVVPSRDNIDRYKEMKKEIEATVGRINGKFSSMMWRPIIYQYKSLSFAELVALYDLSDVGLITPLRDGMNLVAKEYVACQLENVGILILSEMTGAASELNEAIIINPADTIEVAESIHKALEMPKPMIESIVAKMQKRIKSYNVFTWAQDFFNQTYHVKEAQEVMSVKFVNVSIQESIIKKYKTSNKRIIFLDYDGTLVPFSKYPENAILDSKMLDIIALLSSYKQNTLVIISGRDKDFLESQFHKLPVDLVAEHGYYSRKNNGIWARHDNIDLTWKDNIRPILQEYVDRCTGTFIEEKVASLAWHYRNAEIDFASMRLIELKDDLRDLLSNKTGLNILEGNKVLEIKSTDYNKGSAALHYLNNTTYDFMLAIGDDKTDESLFKALPDNAVTIKIGTDASSAKYNLRRQYDVVNFLSAMIT